MTEVDGGHVVPGEDLPDLLCRAASGDVDAFGDFVEATAAKALLLVRAMGCADPEAVVLQSYGEAWAQVEGFAAQSYSPFAWILAQVQRVARSCTS